MMLVGPSLRVVPITTHIALKEVPEALSIELIKARALATAKGLQKNFAIHSPRLVIAGLNPHAGEDGALGMEEIDIIIPAVEQLRAEGLDITGPLPADSLFHERVLGRYYVALFMYHYRPLIPLQPLPFFDVVNITLCL